MHKYTVLMLIICLAVSSLIVLTVNSMDVHAEAKLAVPETPCCTPFLKQ
jgi:hypothetical protein